VILKARVRCGRNYNATAHKHQPPRDPGYPGDHSAKKEPLIRADGVSPICADQRTEGGAISGSFPASRAEPLPGPWVRND